MVGPRTRSVTTKCKRYATPTLVTPRCLHTFNHILSLHTTHTYLRLLFHDYSGASNTVKAHRESPDLVHIGTANGGVPQGCVLCPPFHSFIQTLLCGPAQLCHLHRLSGPSLLCKSGPDLDASDPHHHWNGYTAARLPPQTEETWTPGSTIESVLTGCITTWYNRSPQSPKNLVAGDRCSEFCAYENSIFQTLKWHQNIDKVFFIHTFTNAPPTPRLADYWNCNLMSLL